MSQRNWIVVVSFDDSGERDEHGPYTEASAEKATARINEFYKRRATALDEDEPRATAHCYPIHKWKRPALERSPKRPACPGCKRKLAILYLEYTDEYQGLCHNPDCENYSQKSIHFPLVKTDKRYDFREPQEQAR